jgi:SAM-dependent methyltransferase
MNPPPKSPLSILPPTKLYDLSRAFLLSKLSDYFQSPCPPEAVAHDYSMWRCVETSLEFAWPLVPGNEVFYDWISRFPSYYPKARWEYAKTLSLIRSRGPTDISLLDVGCGSGKFLAAVKSLHPKRALGLDLNRSAILECRQKGLDAFCGSMQLALHEKMAVPHEFHFISSFHCLEHVDDPAHFCRELLHLLSDSGRIFLSTPYSPMSFEGDWFDVMNHPPHHMTRWNLSAYRHLAKALGLSLEFHAPAVSSLRQARLAERLNWGGPGGHQSLLGDPGAMGKRLMNFWSAWNRLRARNRSHPLGGADVILAELFLSP